MAAMQTRTHGGQVILALHGDLDLTCAADAAAAVTAAAGCGRRVIVDLAGLDFMDCSALAALAASRRQARRDGGDVLLAAPRGLVLRLLTLTSLDGVLGVYPSVAAASTDSQRPAPDRDPAAAKAAAGS